MKRLAIFSLIVAISANADAVINIDWMDLSTVNAGADIATGNTFNLPGYGSVTVTYTPSPVFPLFAIPSRYFFRDAGGLADGGSVTSGPETYTWTDLDFIAGVNGRSSDPVTTWEVTFTFNDGPTDNIVFGIWGLAHKSSQGFTSLTLNQGGTELGQFDVPTVNTAPINATLNPNSITVVNSATQPDPAAGNSDLGIYEIANGSLTSLTLTANSHVSEDGVGFNIGVIPEPSAFGGFFGLTALLAALRRQA